MRTSEENIREASKTIKDSSVRATYNLFMAIRFPAKHYYTAYNYAIEWVNRLLDSEPEAFMDEESQEAYIKAKEEANKLL